jgi:rhamnosyltransferase
MQQSLPPNKPRVAVLLAAYNGMKWIDEQVRSILQQEGVEVCLFISVDPSEDETSSWCRRLAAEDTRVMLLPEGQKFGGAARNFFRLIRDVDFSMADYMALADQDDIWFPEKLSVAVMHMKKGSFSAYSSSVTAVWADGRQLLIDKAQAQRRYDFLFEAAGPGCTYVLACGKALELRDFLIKNWVTVNKVALHDWLIYAWFRANGLSWYIDPTPRILYRQHDSNQVGANQGIKAILSRLKMLNSGWYRAEIGKISLLVGDQLAFLREIVSRDGTVSRLFLLRNAFETRRRLRDQLFFFTVVMLGLY